MNRIITVPILAAALAACGSSYQNPPVTTTSAHVRTPPPASPAPDAQLPQLPEQAIPENENPPPQLNATPSEATTEMVQSTDSNDQHLAAALLKAIKADNTLSASAKDVEVITSGRKVVLKGKVKTEKERMDIDTKARALDGVIDVDDRIELAP